MTRHEKRNVLRNEVGNVLADVVNLRAWVAALHRRVRHERRRTLSESSAIHLDAAATGLSFILDTLDAEEKRGPF